MTYILAIDQGTSSTRAMLYTIDGRLTAISQYPLTQYYPQPGWVEHCPEEIWTKTKQALQDVCSQVDKTKILGCGMTNQRETIVLWHKETGECLYRAIVWQDRRTQTTCDALAAQKIWFKEKTGLFPDPYFSASKLQWLLTHIPEAKQLADKNLLACGTIDTFLLWRLSKGKSHYTDVTNASRTLLFNIFKKDWDMDLLALFNIPETILPTVLASDSLFGFIDAEYLGVSIPITAIAGDQQAALIGQRCFTPGMIKVTYGTGGFLLINTGEQAVLSDHLLTSIAYNIKGQTIYCLEGSLYHAGTTVKWLRDEMKLIETAAETEALAASLTSNDGVYFIPSFTGLGAPYWSNTPGAVISGLTRTTNRAHFARAALESVCYLTRELLDCMREVSHLAIQVLRVDGGMAANNWFLQFLANQCEVMVQKPIDIETTAQGAALLASLYFRPEMTLESLQKDWQLEKEFMPADNNEVRARNFAGWQQAIRMLEQ